MPVDGSPEPRQARATTWPGLDRYYRQRRVNRALDDLLNADTDRESDRWPQWATFESAVATEMHLRSVGLWGDWQTPVIYSPGIADELGRAA